MLKHPVSYAEPADFVTTIVLNLQSRFALFESNLRMFATDVMKETNVLLRKLFIVQYKQTSWLNRKSQAPVKVLYVMKLK